MRPALPHNDPGEKQSKRGKSKELGENNSPTQAKLAVFRVNENAKTLVLGSVLRTHRRNMTSKTPDLIWFLGDFDARPFPQNDLRILGKRVGCILTRFLMFLAPTRLPKTTFAFWVNGSGDVLSHFDFPLLPKFL